MVNFVNRPKEFWRVNSYSYPCFFSDNEKAKEACDVLLSFLKFKNYNDIKLYWDSGEAPRRLNPSALESWKATFEECGFLYVISRSNKISITPAGRSLFDYASENEEEKFVWAGINLLIRYPLKGPRRARNEIQGKSDLFLYRFVFAALIELDNYIWWSELERVLCRVFQTSDASSAIKEIKYLRQNPSRIIEIGLPVSKRKGAFYNSLNQVANHASMNHLLLETQRENSPYFEFGSEESNKRLVIRPKWLSFIKKALIADQPVSLCHSSGSFIDALPSCPSFATEDDYFTFLGANVLDYNEESNSPLKSLDISGELVHYLIEGEHFSKKDLTSIVGKQRVLCQLSRGQRLILSSNESWTFFVVSKEVCDASSVKITLQRGRPISNFGLLRSAIEDVYETNS